VDIKSKAGKNLFQKIIENHLVDGVWSPGSEIAIQLDQTLTHDNGGALIFMYLEAMGIEKIHTEPGVCYLDHNTVQIGYENADDHQYLRAITAKSGVILSRAGNGISHQVHLERFGKPGKILLGADSHTSTAGGIGMIGIGTGGLDVAIGMSGEPFYLKCPGVVKINLVGKPASWVSAKDVVLKVLEIFTTEGNKNTVFEYGGPGVASLTVPDRATIANMGAECGVVTSIFPSDDQTKQFLKGQAREHHWSELPADSNAEYTDQVDIDLAGLEPMIAFPHSPENVKRVKDVAGIPVDQVAIGSCTNSSYMDLTAVAKILKGRTLHPDVSLGLAPGSKQVLMMLAKEGSLYEILSSGARIMESACGFCNGSCFSPKSNSVSVRTSNRNFQGRSGTTDARVYLASPQTAAATAITGKITDPRDLNIAYPAVSMPKKFLIDDSMLIFPPENPRQITVEMGPNLCPPPSNLPLPNDIYAEVTIKLGDKVTTDHIMPGGARNKYRANIPKYSEYVFEVIDHNFYQRALTIKERGEANVIIAGESYGQGSAREHAALCPMFLGVKIIIAKSFERIHRTNLINFGIIPLIFNDPQDYNKLEIGAKLDFSNLQHWISGNGRISFVNKTKNITLTGIADLSSREKKMILAGGAVNYIKNNR